MSSQVAAPGPLDSQDGQVTWPVRAGTVPPLAEGFSPRPESAASLGALVPGALVLLAPDRVTGAGSPDWLGTCGKTQLAVFAAESLWASREVDLLAWVTATSRAAILAGFVAAAEAAGTGSAGSAESVAVRFLGWLSQTGHPWLIVLDGLVDGADLDGLWPSGPAGRTLVTVARISHSPRSARECSTARAPASSQSVSISVSKMILTGELGGCAKAQNGPPSSTANSTL